MNRWYRSTHDRVFSGLCGGLSRLIDIDPTLVRLIAILIMVGVGIFPFLIGYLFLTWTVPEDPYGY
jgi:phage shock protein PspC (stress-responsive transcriptional regulator)